MFENFLFLSKNFLHTGETGNLDELLEKYVNFIKENQKEDNSNYKEFSNLATFSIKQTLDKKKNLRANDLISAMNYFSEVVKNGYKIIADSLPKYVSRLKFIDLTFHLINSLLKKLTKEALPAKNLGQNILIKFLEYLKNSLDKEMQY